MNYSKIIVATDFSPSSDQALKLAEEFRQKSGGMIHLIHASDISTKFDWLSNDTSQPYLLAHFNQDLKESLNTKILDQVDRCQVKCETEIIIGKAYDALHDRIKKHSADLLVMGHIGASGFMHIGGLTQKMVESATIPVLVVKEFKTPKKLAALIDPNNVSEKIFQTASDFSTHSLQVEFISIWPDLSSPYHFGQFIDQSITFSGDEKEKIKKLVKGRIQAKLTPQTSSSIITVDVAQNDVADALNKKLKESGIDLAILIRHHKGMLEKFFLGSMTRKIMNQMNCSLLILPES